MIETMPAITRTGAVRVGEPDHDDADARCNRRSKQTSSAREVCFGS
jgi:hypothetical protein